MMRDEMKHFVALNSSESLAIEAYREVDEARVVIQLDQGEIVFDRKLSIRVLESIREALTDAIRFSSIVTKGKS